jgi:hypothetical protein
MSTSVWTLLALKGLLRFVCGEERRTETKEWKGVCEPEGSARGRGMPAGKSYAAQAGGRMNVGPGADPIMVLQAALLPLEPRENM